MRTYLQVAPCRTPFEKKYVKTLVMAKIGNGHGISHMAVSYYDNMLAKFGEPEIREFSSLPFDREFASRVALSSCESGYRALAQYYRARTANQVSMLVLDFILAAAQAQVPSLGKDSRFKDLVANYG